MIENLLELGIATNSEMAVLEALRIAARENVVVDMSCVRLATRACVGLIERGHRGATAPALRIIATARRFHTGPEDRRVLAECLKFRGLVE